MGLPILINAPDFEICKEREVAKEKSNEKEGLAEYKREVLQSLVRGLYKVGIEDNKIKIVPSKRNYGILKQLKTRSTAYLKGLFSKEREANSKKYLKIKEIFKGNEDRHLQEKIRAFQESGGTRS
jgi:hypothetical protein